MRGSDAGQDRQARTALSPSPRGVASRLAVLAMLGSIVAFAVAAGWGALFGFPEPDASPEKAASLQWHANLAGWLMLLAVIVIAASCGTLAWSRLRARK